ncbi:MAG: hypothetical protein AAF721_30115 [Myxococcota bacterium]
MHRFHRLLPLVLSSTLLPGCGVLERWACGAPEEDCNIPPEPAAGSPQDATLAGTADEHATITDVEFCELVGEEETNMVHITTHGTDTDPDFSAWVIDRLVPELHARDLYLGRGLTPCPHPNDDNDVSYGLSTSDWGNVDPALRVIRELAIEDDVAIELSVVVEPVVHYCAQADDACGV